MRAFLTARKYPALLTVVSIGILVFGMLLKPKKGNTESIVSESEMMRLQQMSQKRNLEDATAFFARVAADAGAQVIYVPQARASGIVWNPAGEVVTVGIESPAEPLATVILPDGRQSPSRLQPSDTPVGALRITDSAVFRSLRPATIGTTPAGSWAIQVARRANGTLLFTPGMFRGVRDTTCAETHYPEIDTSIDVTPAMAGGGLFDLDGELLGIVTPCGNRTMILAASAVDAALHPKVSPAAALEKQWGARLAPLDDAARSYFHSETGVLVKEINSDSVADRSGIAPGDVLLDFNGEPVDSVERLEQASASAPEGSKVTLLRGGRKRVITFAGPELRALDASTSDGDIGLRMQPPPEGYLVGTVSPDSLAGRAGVRAGDRLLEVNGNPVRRFDDLGKLLKKPSGGPLYLLLTRAEKQVGILLP